MIPRCVSSFFVCVRITVLFASILIGLRSAEGGERSRELFNNDWRFVHGDPADSSVSLDYTAAKPWLLPMGNELLNDRDHLAQRPAGNFGSGVAYIESSLEDSKWRPLNLPHDWGIEGPFTKAVTAETGRLPWTGIGWYRKRFVPPSLEGGQRLNLQFDGAMSNALVWCNGEFVGGWPYGYASWQVDLTAVIKPGVENIIAVRLENLPESSRWYPGAGLYRNVWLEKTSALHVPAGGIFVTTPVVSTESATVNVSVEIHDSTGNVEAMKIKHQVWGDDPSLRELVISNQIFELDAVGQKQGSPVAVGSPYTIRIHDSYTEQSVQALNVIKPKLWSLEAPNRYLVETTVSLAGQRVDQIETRFGIRTAVFTVDQGFVLNGKRVPLQGVCLHHDLGALGSAINDRALERRVQLLKEMGCNAIRTSHNPPAPELLDLCDRYGLVVMDEAFDCWEIAKKDNGYNLYFSDWHEKDLKAFIRRDRNHPSVVIWSIGNEVAEQSFPEPWHWARRLTSLVHEEDSSRPTTSGFCFDTSAFNGLQSAVDVTGLNYRPYLYTEFRRRNPTLPLVGSETASAISSRGEYFFPVTDDKRQGRVNFQVSSYDLSASDFGMLSETEFKGQAEHPFVAGEFVWTGFDYLGEPTPYGGSTEALPDFSDPRERAEKAQELASTGKIELPTRSSYYGILDLAGFPKDRYYLYQAHWRPDFPMAHILPHWTWPDRIGEITPVHVYSSGDEAELFLNGRSLGRRKRSAQQYRFRWDEVKYEPGELKVVVYKQGKRWATASEATAGAEKKILLLPDRTTIQSNGNDLSFITVKVADAHDILAPRSHSTIQFSIEGPGEIVAVDNGNPISFEPFQASQREAFNGLAQVIVRATHAVAGKTIVHASSPGLMSAETTLTSLPSKNLQ